MFSRSQCTPKTDGTDRQEPPQNEGDREAGRDWENTRSSTLVTDWTRGIAEAEHLALTGVWDGGGGVGRAQKRTQGGRKNGVAESWADDSRRSIGDGAQVADLIERQTETG